MASTPDRILDAEAASDAVVNGKCHASFTRHLRATRLGTDFLVSRTFRVAQRTLQGSVNGSLLTITLNRLPLTSFVLQLTHNLLDKSMLREQPG